MNNIEEVRLILGRHFKQKEVDYIMKGLNQLSFFTLPASTQFHSATKGGLAKHSLNVYNKCMDLLPVLGDGINEKDVAICSLFHDLNKTMSGYEHNILKSGEVSKAKPYTRNPILTGDGSTSCYLIRDVLNISLSPAMYNAIANHNIWEEDWKSNSNIIKKNKYTYRLMLILVTSDLYCSQVLEVFKQ